MGRKQNVAPAATPVDSIKHADKRTNIPTADAELYVAPEDKAIRQARFDRDDSLDPQLVWRGKYPAEGAEEDLVADAPPIYIQEKIDPRVLIENLRRTALREEDEPELHLFEAFDGLNPLDQVDFYKHEANWSNRMILGDALQVMASLAEREKLRGQVQMIYIDPPYGIKFGSNWQVSVRRRDVKDGKLDDAAREAEQIKAFRDTWELGIHSYLSYLRDRLLVARDLLTESGSCFVQIGDENVHLVRSLMDEVFGSDNFISLIVVQTTTGAGSPSGGTRTLAGVNDFIVWYAKDRPSVKYRQLYRLKSIDGGADLYNRVMMPDGTWRQATTEEFVDPSKLPQGERLFRPGDLTSQSSPESATFPVKVGGREIRPSKGGWKTNSLGMERLRLAGRLFETKNHTLQYVRYLDDIPGTPLNNVWTDVGTGSFTEDKIFIVQTNVKILLRCILMSTDPGDLVLDPTCGSGSTAFVAEQWGRRWITIDTSRVALALARQRLMGAKYPWYLLTDSAEGCIKEHELNAKFVPPSQFDNDVRMGFVCERIQHIMLKSITTNPDIKEGMDQEEIDAAIKRHADFHTLYDRPYENPQKVRVPGPFTVESLSPHRSLAFDGEDTGDRESRSEAAAAVSTTSPTFEQTIMDNLARAGIQNGRRRERIKFSTLEPYAGDYIQAIGVREHESDRLSKDLPSNQPVRIAVSVGPQYGTVSASFVKAAAREALSADGIDLLCVLGFAFDPQVIGLSTEGDGAEIEATDEGFANVESYRKLGRLPILMVRMNVDLLMGQDLRKTEAGNLFTVFGEPDIEIKSTSEGYVARIKGVDVFDPTTGEVRSNNTDRIALWMIDTNYDGDSFFVRHCYFTGGYDPYKRLKNALKADIDPEAWASLNSDSSRPFPRPDTGKIAVKVINEYGDEVMKVFHLSEVAESTH